MANVPISNMTATWTDSGTTYNAIKMNVTDTASNAASLLMDLQVGGVSKFNVGKFGVISTDAISLGTWVYMTSNGITQRSTAYMGFTNGNANGTIDTVLYRDAAGTLAQRNSTNAQTFRVYNTYTDASNYERGKIAWESNLLVIGTEAAGSGTSRRIRLSSGNGEIAFGAGTNDEFGVIGSVFRVTASNAINWSSLDNNVNSGFDDLGLSRSAAGILVLTNGSTGGGSLELREQTAPAAPAANNVRIYAEDNGSGKTRLMALFNTGAAVQIAIEP